ncbi:MAG: EVE domain-containing protein [Chloroflexota bacterium]|nr:MAG: EVE domain-containing protein [Chloroflexota bacterium]
MSFWLLKTEADAYSYADLVRDGIAEWDGVTNPTAQRNMRAMAVGDRCVIYHTGDERRAIGLAEIVRAPYADPTDPTGRRVWVDLRATGELPRPVGLVDIKAMPIFATSPLVTIGRLSVVPLTSEQFEVFAKAL